MPTCGNSTIVAPKTARIYKLLVDHEPYKLRPHTLKIARIEPFTNGVGGMDEIFELIDG